MILNAEIKQTKGFYIPWIIWVNCTFVFYINKLAAIGGDPANHEHNKI